ncbi:HvfC/BufC N-terminal domain-containing protein [Frigidibacter oleivorans]|uniref:HvfC/BufC N-terminal domain-containing protein n=1 Tax=Frigidibacter oleivorans TaxID=2487129 RepID=UPI0013DF05A7|nr:putative DNA-binding domain-containing protein [Frigidibacter oleivorans]
MPAHADLTAAFRRGLATGTLPGGVTATAPDEAARRFAVYRNNVAHSLCRALARRYPVVERLVGAEFFAAMAPLYLQADPPVSPLLFRWGEGFAGFLERFPPVAALPYLPDVARLEWLRGVAHHAADRPPLPPAAMAGAGAAATLRIGLHPSAALLRSRHAVVTIWRANQPGTAPAPVDPARPEIALVLRDPADRVHVDRLDAGDAAFVAALLSGGTLLAAAAAAEAADPSHDPAPVLGLLARRGALTDPRSDPCDP